MTNLSPTDQCINCPLSKVSDPNLSNGEIEKQNKLRIVLSYKKGENICKQGAFISSIICIRSGLVKVYKENDNVPFTLFLKKRGGIIGLQSLDGEGVFHCSTEALTDTQACLIDLATFKRLLLDNSDFGIEIIKHINQDMIEVLNKLVSFSTKHVHGRLAELLMYLQKNIYGTNPFFLTLSKTDLAEILATSKESVSRLFNELKHDGIIEESGHLIRIVDEHRLKRISLTG
jgi:CRP-like cAMP-binding protein